MKRRHFRHGFTLIELIMVVFIIGMLTALTVTGIQSARESGRRAQCMNKMREIALAVEQFEQTQRHYPGWRHYPFGATDAVSGRPVTFSTNWFPQLLPFLGRNDLFEPSRPGSWKYPIVTGGVPIGSTPSLTKLAVCPSDAGKMSTYSAVTSYVANTGRRDAEATPSAPADWGSNGVFLDLLSWRGTTSNRVMVRVCTSSFIQKGDGLETTLLLSENNDAGRWYEGRESRVGFIFYPPGQKPNHYINSPTTATKPGGASFLNARPSSHHPGGVNVMFAGGRGTFLSQDIDYAVYCALMTPKGEQAKEPGDLRPSADSIRKPPKIPADLN